MPRSRNRKGHAQKVQSRAKRQKDQINGLKKDMEQFKRNLEALNAKSVLLKTNTTTLTGGNDYEQI